MMENQYNNKELIQHYGSSYYVATLFFPKKIAEETMELYRFVRIPDQIVDGEVQDHNQDMIKENLKQHYKEAQVSLEQMYQERKQTYHDNNRQETLRGDSVSLFKRKKIPFNYSKAFFDAMIMDTQKHRYQTYKELEEYMYGSASVVGLMMCYIIGYEEAALPYAKMLGEAMQLANFLRDIREDYEELGRIYMPASDLKKHGLSHQDIAAMCTTKKTTPAFVRFMKEYIAKNRELYRESYEGIKYLNPKGRKAVYLAGVIYEGILDKIEKNNYNVFAHSCRTNKRDKARLLYKGMYNYRKLFS